MADLVYEPTTPQTELQVITAHPVPKSQTRQTTGLFLILLPSSVWWSKEQNDEGKYGKIAFAKAQESWGQAELQSIDKTVTNQACVCILLSVYVPVTQHCACRWPKPEQPDLVFSLLFLCGFVSLFLFLALIKFLCLSTGQFSSLSNSILNTHAKIYQMHKSPSQGTPKN